MSKKLILIIICLLVLTGCGQSNQLDTNSSKIKDTLVYREKLMEIVTYYIMKLFLILIKITN